MADFDQGDILTSRMTFRIGEVATDPTTVTVRVRKPDGSIITRTFAEHPAEVVKDAVGTYRYQITADMDGIWAIQWVGEGTAAATEEQTFVIRPSLIVEDVPVVPFGASLDGVKGLLPTRTFSSTSMPTIDQVERFIYEIAAEVVLRVGDLSDLPESIRDRAVEYARSAIHLGAAASAEDAGHPEASQDSGYGDRLWERYERAMTTLAEVVDGAVDGDLPDGGTSGSAGHTFPPPLFTTRMRF